MSATTDSDFAAFRAELAFDRAYRRIEAAIDRRLRRAMRIQQPRRSTQFDTFSAAHAWQTLETPISADSTLSATISKTAPPRPGPTQSDGSIDLPELRAAPVPQVPIDKSPH